MAYDPIGNTDLDAKTTRALFDQVEANIEAVKGGTLAASPVNTISGLDGEMTAVEGRLDTAEGDIGDIEADIAALAAIITVPIGGVVRNARHDLPTGYLTCDGSSVLRSSYATLFGLLTTDRGTCLFDIGNDTVEMTAHGFEDGDKISLEGAGPIPVELAKGTTYFVVNKTADDFQVEPSLGGGAITFTWPDVAIRRSVSVVTFDGVNDDVQYVAHPFVDTDEIVFDGAGTIPTGLTKNKPYFVVNAGINSFQVEESIGGGVVDFTDNGVAPITVYRSFGLLGNHPTKQFDYDIDKLNKGDHAFALNDIIELYDPYVSPQTSFTIPNGLAKATPYYVRNPDEDQGAVTMTLADDLINISSHEIEDGDPVVFTGAGTPSAEITLGTTYFARDILTDSFKVATTPGGVAIDLSTDSSGVINVSVKNFELAAASGGAKISFSQDDVDVRYNKWGIADLTHFNLPPNPDSAPWTNIIRHGA